MQKIYKKLPHIDTLEHYQFVTFRTQDSLDDYLAKIESFDVPNAKKQMHIDGYLDSSDAGKHFEGEVLEHMRAFLLSLDRLSYELVSFAIMPNHVHILFYQKEELSLIMQKVKGATAVNINKILKRTGKFWASGYYDKAIRDDKHFEVVYNYIQNNPLKAGLKDVDIRYYSKYETEVML